jgi:hypothetical protein
VPVEAPVFAVVCSCSIKHLLRQSSFTGSDADAAQRSLAMMMDDVRGEVVLRRLPPDILHSLTTEQVAAIRNAASSARARRHPIDARFGMRLPLLGRSYMVLLIGKDLRSPKRRAADRQLRPTDPLSHFVLALLGVSAFAVAALIGILIQNAMG